MADQQPQSLEERLGKLVAEVNKISDETIRDQVLAEITKLRNEMITKNKIPEELEQKVQIKTRSPPKVQIKTCSPPNLTKNYTYLSTHRLTSDVYSTDEKEKPFDKLQELFPKCNPYLERDDIIRKDRVGLLEYTIYYDGLRIITSLINKVRKKAKETGADLVILYFTTKRPFKFRIYKVSGLGKYNYVGEISAKFYARK